VIMASSQPVVLITGASSGVGQATARQLAQRGYQVFGTSRNPARAEAIAGTQFLALDVREDESVAACVAAVIEQTGRLDVLFNNAGYEQAGAIEEVSIEEAKAQFETNVFGILRMNKAVLPHMRAKRSGKIVNMSSVAGVFSVPFLGVYSSTKFAVEAITEALRIEVAPLNIHVSLFEVDALHTPMMDNRLRPVTPIEDYAVWRERMLGELRAFEDQGHSADKVAAQIVKIIESPKPRLRYAMGAATHMATAGRRFFPNWL
jgi:NAD(P)-dependent dehydrogenase (short-subunit alcohol dehydrogenase family)